MQQTDPRDEVYIEASVGALRELLLGTHLGDKQRIVVALHQLLEATIAYDRSLDERRSDEPLRAAIGRLSA